jgi:hypothetical protein
MQFVCGLLFLGVIPLFAQFSGRVTGSVVDSSGASVPDAQVNLFLAGGQKPLLSTKTSRDGQYYFNSVRAATFDLTAEAKGFLKIKANGYYELPIGEGHRLHFKPLNPVIGGWTFGSVMVWQSGAPFSILSSYATLNRTARSYYNGADTTLGGQALKQIVHFQMTGNGPVEIAPSAIDPADGSGVNAPGTPTFAGQIFSNPGPGTLGELQRREFSGPWTFNIDMSLSNKVRITEHANLRLRMEAFNAPNHPTFWPGDQNINSTSPAFGTITSTFYNPRVMEFGAHLNF